PRPHPDSTHSRSIGSRHLDGRRPLVFPSRREHDREQHQRFFRRSRASHQPCSLCRLTSPVTIFLLTYPTPTSTPRSIEQSTLSSRRREPNCIFPLTVSLKFSNRN